MADSLKNIIIALVIGFLAGGLLSAWGTHSYVNNSWIAKVDKQEKEAAKILQAETEKVLAAERENAKLNQTIEVRHAESNKKIDSVLADYRRLVKQRGMRDPGRGQSGDTTQARNKHSSGSPGPTTQSRLSGEASEFLLGLAADAGRAATYAITCHDWVQGFVALKNKKEK